MDPYFKGSYIYERGKSETGLFSIRETLFWQNSEGAGETTRLRSRADLRHRLAGALHHLRDALAEV